MIKHCSYCASQKNQGKAAVFQNKKHKGKRVVNQAVNKHDRDTPDYRCTVCGQII